MGQVMDWIKTISLELNEVSIMNEPNDEPVGKEEEVILHGVSDELKKLWIFSRILAKEAAQLAIDAKFSEKPMNKYEVHIMAGKAQELKRKSDIVKDIFWLGCSMEAKAWDMNNIGIREGWKVVKLPDDKDDMPPFLKRLMEG